MRYEGTVAKNEIDWLLFGRYALLIALTTLIPVPLLDRGVENLLRRRLVRAQAARHGVELEAEAVATLANVPSGGCLGCVWSVLLFPFRKILRTLLLVFSIKAIADIAMEVLHRALMLEEALELGHLPGDADRVRVAMDKTLISVDTRVVERNLLGVFQDHTNDLNRIVWETTRIARDEVRRSKDAEELLADAIEADELGSGAREMTAAMAAAMRGTGIVPELLGWFRAELGEQPAQVAGLVEPELLPPDEPERPALPEPDLEEAEEVSADAPSAKGGDSSPDGPDDGDQEGEEPADGDDGDEPDEGGDKGSS